MKKISVDADTRGMKKTTSTEKKPLPVPATRIVLEILLPFLNLNPQTATDADLFRSLKTIADRLADNFSDGFYSNSKAGKLLSAWKEDSAVLAKFRKALAFSREIIIQSAKKGGFMESVALPGRQEGEIGKALSVLTPLFSFYGMEPFKGHVFPRLENAVQGSLKGSFKTQKEFDGVWVPGLRAIILYYVVTAYQLVETGRKGAVSPVGWHYIGYCHKEGCGKIFRKTRSNQEFCSKAHQDAERQKRHRKKGKE